MPVKKRCAIVGAAASGLPSARWALAYDLEPVVFERLDKLGGLWRYEPEVRDPELASVYKSTVIDTSKEMNAYSDFPPPANFANYMHNTQMIAYMELYAQHHGLNQYIRYRHTVLSVNRSPDYASNGRWTVRWRDAEGDEHEEEFDCVLLAQGHHAKPKMAQFPGQEQFRGNIIHSHDYKDSQRFEDAVNVVVGVGNSGMDLAVELGRVGTRCYLSTRRGTWILKRVGPGGGPGDYVTSRFKCCVWDRVVPERVRNLLEIADVQKRFDHAKYGIMPKHSFFSQHLTVSDELPTRIITGAVTVKPDISRFTPNGVVWADGTATEGVDNVVMCTGYLFDFGLVEGGQLIPVEENSVRLFKNMLPSHLSDWNTLGIIGLTQPSGSILPTSEMQARVFFSFFTGQVKAPSREAMEADIVCAQASLARFVKSSRHTIEVPYVPFLDQLADIVGCKPSLWECFLRDPRLAHAVLFGPNVSYVYRLRGPHHWEGARKAIMGVPQRTLACLSERQPDADWHRGEAAMTAAMMGTVAVLAMLLCWILGAILS